MNRRVTDEKPTAPTNPKDRVAGTKLPCGLAPDTASIGLALAFLEGALKYGRYNWRVAGVVASVYNDALERHRKKWWNGQNCDPLTKVHHLDNLMACAAILRDAELYGMLTDDRPPCPNPDAMAKFIDDSSAIVTHLKELFKDHNPRQFKIGDLPPSMEAALAAAADKMIQEITGASVPAGTAEPVMAFDTPEVLAPPTRCETPGCYESYGHTTPHADYEGVRFPAGS